MDTAGLKDAVVDEANALDLDDNVEEEYIEDIAGDFMSERADTEDFVGLGSTTFAHLF